MDKRVWVRMEQGMIKGGFKVATRIHKSIEKSRKTQIIDRMKGIYPTDTYEWRWYTDHNGYLVLFVKPEEETEIETEIEDTPDSNLGEYTMKIINRLERQKIKGMDKYGMSLESNVQIGYKERMEHLAEELTDGLQYIEHFKKLIDTHSKELINVTSELAMMSSRSYVPGKELGKIAKELNKSLRELHGHAYK